MPNFRTPRIIGRIIKSLFALFILAVNALLLWRVFFSTKIPESISTMIANQELRAAYEQYGDDLTLRYQEQSTVTRAEYNYGYFSVPQCIFIPEADQVQVIVRYNKSTFTHLAEDYSLAEEPERTAPVFDVTLVKTTDLTPDNKDDNIKAEFLDPQRYFPTEETVQDTTDLYTYYRYVFEGVSVDKLTVGVFVDIYYTEDCDYSEKAYGTLCVFDDQSKWREYDLTKADKKALTANE